MTTYRNMSLFRLTYASVARAGLGQDELLAILRTAKDYNTLHCISGLLYYGNGMFLQVLEGSRSAVTRLYNRITHDARSRDCELINCGAIATRNYGEWSMRLAGISRLQMALHLASCGLESFDPLHMTAGQAADFLAAVAASEREFAGLQTAV
jgi:Sensors of blue-light using FAD